ncbi:FG-GAP-like repeat-containing protein, partial [Dysgonomonas sp. HGC4]|uniref:FG-GAP-like repeat-containing protein n=2 Tax=Dysgonomonas sp. HGC4 TaxID=1658009 RepID=UPI00177BF013
MRQYKSNKIFKFLVLTIFCCFPIVVYGQDSATDGQEFYISFTQNYDYTSASTSVKAQVRYVVKETCYITAQYGDGTYLDNNILYYPGVYTKDADKTKCYTDITGTTPLESNRLIKITSTKNIGVFAINLASNTTDATTVLPSSALGNDYTIISHDLISGNYVTTIQVISKDDGTTFTIKDKNGAVLVSNKSLAAGKVYTYGSKANMTGYTVESNYNIAVLSAVGCGAQISSGACDYNVEQMWPTNTAGKNYFLWNLSTQSFSANTKDKVQILALEDNTVITKKIGAVETSIPLNRHGTNSFLLDTAVHINSSSAPVKLTANKPIIVEQFLGYAPSIKWISPAEQSITKAIISPFIPSGSSVITAHQLHVMIPNGTQSDMVITETRLGVPESVILNYYTNLSDPTYVIGTRTYGAVDNVLIEMSNPSGFIAYMTGYGQSESYIFTAGAGAFNLQAYYKVTTKTSPYKDTYYSATTPMTHTFEEIDEITIKRTIEKSFSNIHWLLNGVPYTGVTENTDISKEWNFPASDLTVGENTLTMSVRYTGNSADSLYKSKIWLSGISSYPDNVVDPTCVKEADPAVWGIEESLPINKTDLIHNYAPLTVGDIDGDGEIEIIGLLEDTRSSNGYESNGVKIFNYKDNEVKLKKSFNISVGGSATASFGSMAIARYNNQGYIVLVGVDMYLYAYNPNGDRLWKSDVVCSKTAVNMVNIADFNNDGIPEVYVDNNIFSLANGKLLCSGQANNTGSMTVNGSSPMAIDIDNDGKLELCAGTQIYKVNITNTNGTAGNTMTVIADMGLLTTDLPQYAAADGMTQLVDMDGDGMLEVVVTSRLNNRVVVYIWKPQPDNGSYLMGSYLVPATNVSYNSIPMIGDIDNDGYPEIVFITNGSSFLMYALDFNPSLPVGNMLKEKWTLTHTDGSGCTGMSLFDFNLDGTAEIVYRDQTTLRIIDGSGSTPIVKETFSNVLSGTLREYPVIADLDKDGQAEIVVTGSDGGAISSNAGYLRVFKSSQTQWAPARSVWNQYNYNSVNVNENLTIPAVQFPITTRFKGKDGVMGTADDIRVFNNFRQQQTYLNKDGVAFMKIPNAKVLNPEDISFTYHSDGDSLAVNNLIVTNVGEASLKAPLKITIYKDAVSTSSRKHFYEYPISIGVGEAYTIPLTIPDFGDWLPVNKLIVKVNDAGLGVNDQQVCDSCCVNNESDAFVNVSFDNIGWADSYRKCEDGTVLFDALTLPGGSVTYKWLKPDGTLLASTKSTSLSHLTLNNAGKYVLTADKINNNLSIAYTLPYLSVAPSLMYWREDAKDSNWNNLNNWAKSSLLADTLKAVPSVCTTVHLPAYSLHYPSLDAHTDRTIYGDPVTDKIVFHFGSELSYPHKLTYNKAFIQYNWGYYAGGSNEQPGSNAEGPASKMITRDRWYMLAAPLK